MRKLLLLGLFVIFQFLITNPAFAFENEAGSTARLVMHSVYEQQEQIDVRVVQLEAYFKKYNSPLVPHAKTFITQADKHDLDWKLVPAIAGLESTFGKAVPYNSYNPFGWGIPTGASSGIGFDSWDHAIETVSEGLKTRYIDRGLTNVESIGRVYAASPTWSQRIHYFMNDMEEYNFVDNSLIAMSL